MSDDEHDDALRAAFRDALPGADDSDIDLLMSGARATAAWREHAKGVPLRTAQAVAQTFDTDAGRALAISRMGKAKADPAPLKVPPTNLQPWQQMAIARGEMTAPTMPAATSTDMADIAKLPLHAQMTLARKHGKG